MAKKRQIANKAADPITDLAIGYSRTATRMKVARAVWLLWEQLKKEDKVDQQWLADRLGKHKGQVSRLLNAPGNWTMDTVADLLEAMEGRITVVEVKRYKDIAASSIVAPSLRALRETPELWNVTIIVKADDIDSDSESIYLDNEQSYLAPTTKFRLIKERI